MCYKSNQGLSCLYIIKAIAAIFAVLGLTGCESGPDDPVIDFAGDSIIARWDVNQDFPSYCVYNYGVGGSGIELLRSYESKFVGNDVVVLSGTNDNAYFSAASRENYALNYLTAIEALTDRRIYLFSVLPRKFKGDSPDINDNIKAFNQLIKNHIKNNPRITYLDVYDEFLKDNDIDLQYFSDGLHPNVIGYEILTHKLLKSL